jgi:hypothetical protein
VGAVWVWREKTEREKMTDSIQDGVALIAAERQRQITKLGWTPEHDDEHDDGSLALAAVCYATPVQLYVNAGTPQCIHLIDPWPESWSEEWDKRPVDEETLEPREPTEEEKLRMLTKAGALIAAEIDRRLRLQIANSATGQNGQ